MLRCGGRERTLESQVTQRLSRSYVCQLTFIYFIGNMAKDQEAPAAIQTTSVPLNLAI